MLMNYQSKRVNNRMGLEEAINEFGSEICYLTLKDGSNIEIIQNNQPEMGYMGNNYHSQYDYKDEFIEEIQEENMDDFYNQNFESNQPELLLRGRGQNKKFGKSLRKTVLKSIDGKEKVKEITKGKLRSTKDNIIVKETENNDFLQCAHCFKFFPSDENETESEKERDNINQQTPNKQQLSPQAYQPHNNQFFPKNQQTNKYITQNQAKAAQKPSQQPKQINPGQKIPQVIPKRQQQAPASYQQKGGTNQRGKINIPQGRGNQIPIPQQFRAQNPIFRARKKVSTRYESNNDRYFNSKNNQYLNNNVNDAGNYYYYPASGKKQKAEYILCEECSSGKKMKHNTSYGNLNVARNLQYGFSGSKRDFGNSDNNITEFMDYGNTENYEYPSNYQRKNYIPAGYNQGNNHKVITIRTVRNDYQDYVYY